MAETPSARCALAHKARPALAGHACQAVAWVSLTPILGELLNLLLLLFSLLLRHISGRRSATPDEIRRFYKSAEWKRLRYAQLAKSPACLACGRSPRMAPA